jgi:kynureninase
MSCDSSRFISLLNQTYTVLPNKCESEFAGRWLADFLDENDPLRNIRDEFHFPKMRTLPNGDYKLFFFQQLPMFEFIVDLSLIKDPEEDSIYLCGNSLGLMPKCIAKLTEDQFQKWAQM